MTRAIEVSVVVPAVNTLADVERTLTALAHEATSSALEILLVDRTGDALRAAVRRQFPDVRVMEMPEDATIPAMRLAAFTAARGRYVAVIEDHVAVPHGWVRAMVAAMERGHAEAGAEIVVGGSVSNAATKRVVDWAAFLCEYSHCIAPMQAGPTDWLTGNNVIYPRSLLMRYLDRLSPDRWENHLHDMLRADGVTLVCRPEITIGHEKYYTVPEYVGQRYLYARSFAGARTEGAPLMKRVAIGTMALGLPPLLLGRIVSRVIGKRRHRTELARSVPLLFLFVSAWALGEVAGYWFGAGDALKKVR